MEKSKFTEEQIVFALKQAELGTRVEEVCRKMGISEATFYVWKKRYGGVGPSELRRLRQLEEENRKLKQIVADLSLDKAMLQAVGAATLCRNIGNKNVRSTGSTWETHLLGVHWAAQQCRSPVERF